MSDLEHMQLMVAFAQGRAELDPKLTVEYGQLCIRSSGGWLVWSCKLSLLPKSGVELGPILEALEDREREEQEAQHEAR